MAIRTAQKTPAAGIRVQRQTASPATTVKHVPAMSDGKRSVTSFRPKHSTDNFVKKK
jgi:hypothetical protein